MLCHDLKHMLHTLQGRWKWALQFFALSERQYLHPCQLLAAVVPAFLAADTASAADGADNTALLDAARVCLREMVASEAPEQSADVSALFMELLDAQPAQLLTTLKACRRSRRPRMQDISSSHVSPRPSMSV